MNSYKLHHKHLNSFLTFYFGYLPKIEAYGKEKQGLFFHPEFLPKNVINNYRRKMI